MPDKLLKPIIANAGLEAAYRRRLHRLIEMMERSTHYWVKAAYRGNEPATVALAQDESAIAALRRVIRALARRWQRNFNEAAKELAEHFSKDVSDRTDAALKRMLKKGGYSVTFRRTPVMRDALNAVIAQNVGLIRSIPREYLKEVEQAVMRSAAAGRDLKQLTDDIEQIGGVTRRRAAFIALDQTNKASTYMTRARQLDVGIDEGLWKHSHAGKTPRPTHLANDGKRFSLRYGWPDPALGGKRIWPGTEPRCRCFWVPIVKGA
jgi:SPP1 gp7 family putative phage head morphogenesis protein